MNATHHADVLVVGHSLEGALTAALLARRGTNVLWLGEPPAPFATQNGANLRTAPTLTTSLENQPALRTALGELALELDLARRFDPVSLQLLGERRRFTFPDDLAVVAGAQAAFSRINERVKAALEPSRHEYSFGALGLRALAKNEDAFVSLGATERSNSFDVDALLSGLALAVGEGRNKERALIPIASAPHRFDGGIPALVTLLHQRFKGLGGRALPQALAAPAREFRVEFRGVRIVLSNGDTVSAANLVLALSKEERERLLPAASGLFSRGVAKGLAGLPEPAPLVRTTWLVNDSGLPTPLGPVAVVSDSTAATPILLERHHSSPGVSELSAHRLATREGPQGANLADTLEPYLPFFRNHVLHERTHPVPHHGSTAALPVRFGRVHLALPGVAGLCGWDGAAMIAQAIASKLATTKPRRDVLPASVTQPPPTRNMAAKKQGASAAKSTGASRR